MLFKETVTVYTEIHTKRKIQMYTAATYITWYMQLPLGFKKF
jgi:hypothetical protein